MLKAISKNDFDRFWSKVEIGHSGCWEFTGCRNSDGYGTFRFGKMVKAHRWAYSFWKGEIPEGMLVCHSCDNPACVNPVHLWLGTCADNVADRDAKERRPPPKGEINGRAKLTKADVIAIRADARSLDEIATDYGVTTTNIHFIKTGKTWKHVRAKEGIR